MRSLFLVAGLFVSYALIYAGLSRFIDGITFLPVRQAVSG